MPGLQQPVQVAQNTEVEVEVMEQQQSHPSPDVNYVLDEEIQAEEYLLDGSDVDEEMADVGYEEIRENVLKQF